MRWSRNGRSSSRHNLALRLAAAAVTAKVSLKADALFCSHTAWHIGDVVGSQWSGLTRR
jgi:hypothetical protein